MRENHVNRKIKGVRATLADSMMSLTLLSLPCFLEYIASSLWEISAKPVIFGSL